MMLGKIIYFTKQKKRILLFFLRLFQVPGSGNKPNLKSENIFSWVHKEFKENDINATKHRLLCKLDDMSHG
jgi:hypothetical protein